MTLGSTWGHLGVTTGTTWGQLEPPYHGAETGGARSDAERAGALAGGDGPLKSLVTNRQAISDSDQHE